MSTDLSERPISSPADQIGPASPPPRSARRRGLGYLRSYTHSLSSNSNQPTPASSGAPRSQRSSLVRAISSSAQAVLSDEGSTPQLSHRAETASAGTSSEERPQSSPGDELATSATTHTKRTGISRIMARHRAGSAPLGTRVTTGTSEAANIAAHLTGYPQDQMPTIRLIPHQDPRSSRPSLAFPPTSRTLPHEDCVIRVGRYSERDTNPNPPPNTPSSAPVGFKSKVVSRRHCEFWCSNGQWYIKDVKSSSGTFLNHIRLSQPSVESKPFPVNDGDVVQLGIDFRGGEEMIFRCVKIRVECNRAWQKSLNNFNVTTHKRLRDLGKSAPKADSDAASAHSSECSICLMSIAPCQSLFVAPCSHVWHYKCIRPILNDHKTWPQFLCPNCRAMADLEADVDDPNDERWEEVDPEDPSKLEPNALDAMPATLDMDDDGGELADTTSRLLLIRNATDEALPESQPDPPNPTLSSGDLSSLLSRRNARHSSPPEAILGNDASLSFGSIPERISPFSDYLRPITPTQSLLHDDELTPNTESPGALDPTPSATEMLADGPMTPTNNAGPFVFDGSAGRAAGQRVVSNVVREVREPERTG